MGACSVLGQRGGRRRLRAAKVGGDSPVCWVGGVGSGGGRGRRRWAAAAQCAGSGAWGSGRRRWAAAAGGRVAVGRRSAASGGSRR